MTAQQHSLVYIFGHYDRIDSIFFVIKKSLIYDRKITKNNLASSWSSSTKWSFAIVKYL